MSSQTALTEEIVDTLPLASEEVRGFDDRQIWASRGALSLREPLPPQNRGNARCDVLDHGVWEQHVDVHLICHRAD